MNILKIISRNSPLALWQARWVEQQLKQIYPALTVEIIGITTQGDKLLNQSLSKIGGKGLFIKELELALLRNEADLAVHSLKDLPANLAPEFTLAAILKREEANDALVSNVYSSLEAMPAKTVIGTSSWRRVALLNRYYPHLTIKLLRGNLQTRLLKLDSAEYDAIILAAAGLKRLGLSSRITQCLQVEQFIPAIGQGALAVEILAKRPELNQLLTPLMDKASFITVTAEREVGRYLNANCNIPLAVHAIIQDKEIKIEAMLASPEQNLYCFSKVTAPSQDYLDAAASCANKLFKQGAKEILQRFA